MKLLHTLLAIASLTVVALSHTSCSTTTTPPTLDATLIARAEKAMNAANGIITTAEHSGKLSPANADKLRDQISRAAQALALTGKLDFTSVRSLAATLAASNLLPADYALAIQTALLISDLTTTGG